MTNNFFQKLKEKLQEEAPKRYQNLSEDKKKLRKYQNLAEKEKEKKRQYHREPNKDLSDEQKQTLVEYLRN